MNESELNKERLDAVISGFTPISLTEMDNVKLLDRQDTKLVVPMEQLDTILESLAPDYFMLEVNNIRKNAYTSLYFDTPGWESYNKHHNGRKNRYKVRYRNYVSSDLSFFEIKFKTNKSRTVKTRIRKDDIGTSLGAEEIELLKTTTPLNPSNLIPAIWVYYTRLTLVSKDLRERVTVDLDIGFHKYGESKKRLINSPSLAIIEIKQERFNRKSAAFRTFKNKLLKIAKITNNDYYRSIADCYPVGYMV